MLVSGLQRSAYCHHEDLLVEGGFRCSVSSHKRRAELCMSVQVQSPKAIYTSTKNCCWISLHCLVSNCLVGKKVLLPLWRHRSKEAFGCFQKENIQDQSLHSVERLKSSLNRRSLLSYPRHSVLSESYQLPLPSAFFWRGTGKSWNMQGSRDSYKSSARG